MMIYNFKNKAMIQPQELRIGNNVNTELGIAEVIGIYEDVADVKGVSVIDNSSENKISISTRSFDGCVEYEKTQPIPLTEEILLKLGFNEVEDERWCDMHEEFEECNYYYLSMFKIYYNPETDRFEDDSLNHFNVNLKYVHQLQNLHFSLTGKELPF